MRHMISAFPLFLALITENGTCYCNDCAHALLLLLCCQTAAARSPLVTLSYYGLLLTSIETGTYIKEKDPNPLALPAPILFIISRLQFFIDRYGIL